MEMKNLFFIILALLFIFSCGKSSITVKIPKPKDSINDPVIPIDGDPDKTICETLTNTLSWTAYSSGTGDDLDLGGFRIYKEYSDGEDPLIYELRDSLATTLDLTTTRLDPCKANNIYIRAFKIYTVSEGSLSINNYRPEGSVKEDSKRSNSVCWGILCPTIQAITTIETENKRYAGAMIVELID